MWSPVPDLYKGPKVFWSFALGVLDTEQTLKKNAFIVMNYYLLLLFFFAFWCAF